MIVMDLGDPVAEAGWARVACLPLPVQLIAGNHLHCVDGVVDLGGSVVTLRRVASSADPGHGKQLERRYTFATRSVLATSCFVLVVYLPTLLTIWLSFKLS